MKQTYFLFLSKTRLPGQVYPPHPMMVWLQAKSFEDFVNLINIKFMTKELPGVIAFDHDLQDVQVTEVEENGEKMSYFVEKTGYDCARWLVEFYKTHNLPLPSFTTVTQDVAGSQHIHGLLNAHKMHTN